MALPPIGSTTGNIDYNNLDYTNTSITKAYNVVIDALYNVYIDNDPNSLYIHGKSFSTYLQEVSATNNGGGGGGSGGTVQPDITTVAQQVYEGARNKTCLCSYISSETPPHTYYTNGILMRNATSSAVYVITSFSLLEKATSINANTTFVILSSNRRLFVCKIFKIDRMANILIGIVDPYETDVGYYNSEGVVNFIADIEAYPLNTTSDIDNAFLENTASINNGSHLISISHNSLDTPMFSISTMINNAYYANTLDAFSLQGILVSTELRPNESGALLYSTAGKIAGVMLLNAVYYDTTVDTYYSAQMANVSVALSSFVVNRILKRIFFGVDKQLYWGIVYYPYTIESVMSDEILRKYYATKKELGGLVVTAVVRSFHPTTAKVGYTASIDTGFIPYLNPLIYGTSSGSANTDFTSVINYEADTNIIFDTMTFFSKRRNANLVIPFGRHYGQTSLSPFYYEYERLSNGLYPDVVLDYYYYYDDEWAGATYTIVNKLIARRDGPVNASANFIVGDPVINNNNANYSVNTYQPLVATGEHVRENIPILSGGVVYRYIYVRIYSDVGGTLSFATENTNIAISAVDTRTNPPTSVTMPIQYLGSNVNTCAEYLITLTAVYGVFQTGDNYDISYGNGNATQTVFRLEAIFSDTDTLVLSQLFDMPTVLQNSQNVGIFSYNDMTFGNAHSYNNVALE